MYDGLQTCMCILTCATYTSTIKAMGFEAVRIRCRQERREVVREVIENGLTGALLQQHVDKRAHELVPKEHRLKFAEDIFEDLEQIDESLLVGLGITPQSNSKHGSNFQVSPRTCLLPSALYLPFLRDQPPLVPDSLLQ